MKKLFFILIMAFAGIVSASAQQCKVAGTNSTVMVKTVEITGSNSVELTVSSDANEYVNVGIVMVAAQEVPGVFQNAKPEKRVTILAKPNSYTTERFEFTNLYNSSSKITNVTISSITGQKCK